MRFYKLFGRLCRDQSGATAVEYGLIVALIVLGLFVALNGVADEAIRMWNLISSESVEAMN